MVSTNKNSFKWGDATISARELTIGDEEKIAVLMEKIEKGAANAGGRYQFAEFMIGAAIQGEFPVPLVDELSNTDAVQESYAAWKKLPRRFGQQWRTVIQEVDGAGE